MGVDGLKTYLDPLPVGEGEVWEWSELRDTNVVIDGSGLCYHIYTHIDFKYGGQYDELENKLKDFFFKLRSNDVTPYVVFDGVMTRDDKKLETRKERKKKRINKVKKLCTSEELGPDEILLPRFVHFTFVEVLKDMGVKYAVADFEADCEIASLANELDAPVMAADTDFYIFNIKHGYIPFQQNIFSGTNTTVKKFSHNGFCNHLGINPSMTPLLASLIGNDYISREMLEPLPFGTSDIDSKIRRIVSFLLEYDSISEATDAVTNLYPEEKRSRFRERMDLSIEEYQKTQSNLIAYFEDDGHLSCICNVRTYNHRPLSEWVSNLYRKGLIPPEGLSFLCNRRVFLQTQCEDVSLPSAQICAQNLRWYYYALLLNDVTGTAEKIIVKEFDRKKLKLQKKKKKLTQKVTIRIHDILKMSDQEKTSHLLDILDHSQSSTELQLIHDLPIKHQLVAWALRYWVTHANVKPAHLAALLVHYVGEKESSNTSQTFQFNIEAVHGFSEWQNVLYWVKRLNALFSYALGQLSITRLYNGEHVYRVYKMLENKGITFAESIVTDRALGLYRRLYAGITEDLPSGCYFKLKEIPKLLKNNRYRVLYALDPNE